MMGLGSLNLAGGSAMPFDGFALAMDFKNGLYRSGPIVTKDVSKLPTYSFARAGAKYEQNAFGGYDGVPADSPAIVPGVGYIPRQNATNTALNSMWAGAAVGVAPTNLSTWGTNTTNGITRTIVGIGMENGLPYIDYRYSGTATATYNNYPMINGQAAAAYPNCAPGEVWTLTGNVRILPGYTLVPGVSVNYQLSPRSLDGNTIYGGYTIVTITNGVLSSTQGLRSVTSSPLPANSAKMWSYFNVTIPNGATVDYVMRMSAFSVTRTAFQTAFIPTTGAPADIAADAMELRSPIPLNEDWMFVAAVNFKLLATINGGQWLAFISGQGDNYIYLQRQNDGAMKFVINANGGGRAVQTAANYMNGLGRVVVAAGIQGNIATIAALTAAGAASGVIRGPGGGYPSNLDRISVGQRDIPNFAAESPIEFLGYRRGTFSDDQIRTMVAALSQF